MACGFGRFEDEDDDDDEDEMKIGLRPWIEATGAAGLTSLDPPIFPQTEIVLVVVLVLVLESTAAAGQTSKPQAILTD